MAPSSETYDAKEAARRLLGLPSDADREAVRRQFRKLAFDCHPDRHAGRPEMEIRFKQLNDAYRCLIGGGEAEPREPPDSRAAAPPLRGRDIRFRIALDFLQAAAGGEVPVRMERPEPCPLCGEEEDPDCPRCFGTGEVPERVVLRVEIPSGVEEGERLVFPGRGGAGRAGGPRGDLHLSVSCRRHPGLVRRGLDVYSEVQLPPFRVRDGGRVRVFTVRGTARIDIPPHTPSGRVFRLRGWGIRRVRGGGVQRGDHYVRVVEMPAPATGGNDPA